METSREDFGIAIRSAFLAKGTKQRFSLFVLIILSIIFLFVETIETKPLNYLRSFIKDTIYRGSLVVSIPFKSFGNVAEYIDEHINLYSNYSELKIENLDRPNKIIIYPLAILLLIIFGYLNYRRKNDLIVSP